MKIAVVTAVYPPTRGGMCTVAAAEAEQLVTRNDVTVYTLATGNRRGDTSVDRSFAGRVLRMRGFPRISLAGFVPQLLWHLRRERAVYAHLPAYGFFLPLLLWKKIYKGRLVVTLHMDPIGEGLFRYVFFIERIILKMLLRSADVIRISSERMAEAKIIQELGERHHHKIKIIPFGVDLAHFKPAEKKSRLTFLFIGRLSRTHYFKGVELLLRSFRKACAEPALRQAQLLIVGDGEERQHYEELVRNYKINDRVKFLGEVSNEDLPNVCASATALILPSLDTSETFGLVLLEAFACGTPVIASRLPGVDTLVSDGVTGTLIEPGSEPELVAALIDVAERPQVWITRGLHARERAEGYGDWDIIGRRIESLL